MKQKTSWYDIYIHKFWSWPGLSFPPHFRRIAPLFRWEVLFGPHMEISRIDYCNAFNVGLPLKMLQKHLTGQTVATRLISGARKFNHIFPIMAHLHWLPVNFCARFQVFMTYNSLEPHYLLEHLSPRISTWFTQSFRALLLSVPTLREIKKNSTRNQVFSVVAPSLWYILWKQDRFYKPLEDILR